MLKICTLRLVQTVALISGSSSSKHFTVICNTDEPMPINTKPGKMASDREDVFPFDSRASPFDCKVKSAFWLVRLFVLAVLLVHTRGQLQVNGEDNNSLSHIRKCYDSPSDLFQVYPQLNSTFKIKIKNKCLQLPSLEIYLFAFDLSIVDQVYVKEVDQLDTTKLNMIRINRPVMIFGKSELNNFRMHSKFKFAIVFFDHAGMVDLVLYPKVFTFFTNVNSSTTEIVLIAFLGILLLITCTLLAMLIYINYFGSGHIYGGLLFWRKEDNRKLIKAQVSCDEETCLRGSFVPKSNVIPVDQLLTRIPKLLEGDALKVEYDCAPRSQMFSWNKAKLPEHRTKNRYGNLLPYDYSRVTLKKESPTDTDYMNANFIDGYKKSRRYIAMQGPIDATLEDFWRCVWQYRCQQIVMLTNLEESGKSKCDKYWPEISQFYGKVKVSMQKTELFADYTIRHFLLEKNGEDLEVMHYHFISWPDHMVPLYACTLISFVNCIRASEFYHEASPMIVHCSAGIGRTGAFIMIDSMLNMAAKERKIDVLAHYCKIRQQRINMVEKYAQYRFVYQVLFEALSHEPTDISCTNFASYLEKLIKGTDKNCLLHKQYEILNSMSTSQLPDEVCKFGLVNFNFNRRQDVIPPDYARVILPNLNDYVNAVYVNGYRKQDAYIVTQVPFENNRVQFWRMVESAQVNLIVLLNELSTTDQYWPMAVNQWVNFEEIRVCLQTEEISNDFVVRTFVLKPSELVVKQIQMRVFANQMLSKPTNEYWLIELKEKLDQYNIGANMAPLIVQCMDGVQMCGIFCAADFIFERIKEEQQIDVFLAVQKIRTNRPQFIATYEQYLYLHQVALSYLKSFDHYANFK